MLTAKIGIARKWAIAVGIVIIIVAASGVGYYEYTSAPSAAAKELVIGAVNSSSGAYSAVVNSADAGFMFWLNQSGATTKGIYVKALGGIAKIKFVQLDDHSDMTLSPSLYEQLVTQYNATILINPASTATSVVAVPVAEKYGRLIITGGSDNGYANRFNYSGLIEGVASLSTIPTTGVGFLGTISSLKGARYAVIYTSDAFPSYLGTTWMSDLKSGGYQIVYSASVPTSTTNWIPYLDAAEAANATALIFCATSSLNPPFFNQMKTEGVSFPLEYLFYSTFDPTTFLAGTGTSGLDLFGSGPWETTPTFSTTAGLNASGFVNAWEKAYGQTPSGLNAVGYSEGVLVQQILATSNSFDMQSMKNAVLQLSGHMVTLMGTFGVTANGYQSGYIYHVEQYQMVNGVMTAVRIFPNGVTPVYPMP